MQVVFAERLAVEGNLTDTVARAIACSQGLQQSGVLIGRRIQLDNRTKLHTLVYHKFQTKATVWRQNPK